MSVKTFIKGKSIYFILFIALFVALIINRDYGLSWDERAHRDFGIINYKYVFDGNKSLLNSMMRNYGVAFEWLCIGFEKTEIFTEIRGIMYSRHIITHLLFLLSALYLYKLVIIVWNKEWLGITAVLFYILSPRIYAHSFLNPKDIPFLSVFIISMFYSVKAFISNKYSDYIKLGIIFGLLINIRIVGIIMPVIAAIFKLSDVFLKEVSVKKYLLQIVTFLFFAFITFYVTCPYLWNAPFGRIAESFSNMSNYGWYGEVLFKGRMIYASDLPWYYSLWWMAITIPIPYIVLTFTGILFLIFKLIKTKCNALKEKHFLLVLFFLMCFALPLFIIIYLHSVIYDDWRHLYFIYAGFLLMAVYGLNEISELIKKRFQIVLSIILTMSFLFVARQMFILHPFQNVYFNDFVYKLKKEPEGLRKNYEMDYWGTSFKKGLEYILKNDKREQIKVFTNVEVGFFNTSALFPKDRHRLVFINWGGPLPDYFLSNYRWKSQGYNYTFPEIFNIKIYNSRILSVWKVK